MMTLIRICALLLLLGNSCLALTNGFNLPLMGWNPYYYYFGGTTAQIMSNKALNISTNGTKALCDARGVSYYVNFGAHWAAGTVDGNGVPVPNATKFPAGLAPVITYIHSLGLKVGIPGQGHVCGSDTEFDEGIAGHWTNCIVQYAAWGADMFIFDFADNIVIEGDISAEQQCAMVTGAILFAGRPMPLFIVNIPPQSWSTNYSNMNRSTVDVQPSDGFSGVLQRADDYNAKSFLITRGYWNYADDLQIDVLTQILTPTENRTHFALWCVLGCPIFRADAAIETNAVSLALMNHDELVAINQDGNLQPGTRRTRAAGTGGNLDVWAKPITNGVAIACVNGTSGATNIAVDFTGLGFTNGIVYVRDALNRVNVGVRNGSFTATGIASHDTGVYTLLNFTGTAGVSSKVNAKTVTFR